MDLDADMVRDQADDALAVRRGQRHAGVADAFAEPIDPANIDPTKTGPAGAVGSTVVGPVVDAFVASPLLADRVVVMEAGKLVAEDTPAELLKRCPLFQRLFQPALKESA